MAQRDRGEIDWETYVQRYGHRGPREFEVSAPRPVEDPGWRDHQLAGLHCGEHDPRSLLERREQVRSAAWQRLTEQHPHRAARLRTNLERWSRAARRREQVRSELIRVFWVLRAFVLRAGVATGHGDDLFFLTIDEILTVLRKDPGRQDTGPLATVATRRATYEHDRALPPRHRRPRALGCRPAPPHRPLRRRRGTAA